MEKKSREFYQLVCETYLGDDVYIWEDIGQECATLDECLVNVAYVQHNPEFTNLKVEFRKVTVVVPPKKKGR